MPSFGPIASAPTSAFASGAFQSSAFRTGPSLILQTSIVTLGEKTNEGRLVASVGSMWMEIVRAAEKDRTILFEFAKEPRRFEEFIAASYSEAGFEEVTITPRSGDGGRDVIAVKRGVGSVRFLEQAKAYSPGTLVTHDQVRAMLGVLTADANSSKGLITTTSKFQPEVLSSPEFARFIPYRLELREGESLAKWLAEIAAGKIVA